MHLAVVIISLLITIKYGDWKNWQKYHTTILCVGLGNLLYHLLYQNHLLWQMKSDFLVNHIITEVFYTLIVLPCTVILFLHKYPQSLKGQILRNLKFIAIYFFSEVIFMYFERIVYNYGWNIWWSLAWDFMMFPMWALHHKKPVITYVVSIVIVFIILTLFPIK